MNGSGCFEALRIETASEDDAEEAASVVCPFSESGENEDQLAQSIFGDAPKHSAFIGNFVSVYAGFVEEGDFRSKGSSGGFGKWILYELLRRKLVDAVIQVKSHIPDDERPEVYCFRVMTSADDVLDGSRSVYYPVEMSEALSFVREHPGRYAITGIPCFVKAIRLLQKQETLFAERIAYCIGIVCGHLKSARYADMLAWQLGVEPGKLAKIDFRAKLPGKTAKQKGVLVESLSSTSIVSDPESVDQLFGADYNDGFFQYKACDYCDDVVGETADISIGDAWLPQYIKDGSGTSLIITRNRVLHEILNDAATEGRVHLEQLTVEQAVASQIGGFRQRREGLAYRLHLADRSNQWRPPKRVKPSGRNLSWRKRAIYRMRMKLSERSHQLFPCAVQSKDFKLFRNGMETLLSQYRRLYRKSLWARISDGVKRRLSRLRNHRSG